MTPMEQALIERAKREKKRREAAKNVQMDPTAAGVPIYAAGEAPASPPKPATFIDNMAGAADRTAGRISGMAQAVAGAPVDAATAITNATGLTNLDPSQMPFGSESVGRFAEGTNAGLRNVGRGVGAVDQLSPEALAVERQKADDSIAYTAGELFGEVAPFVAPATWAAKITSLVPRVLFSGFIGGSEGNIVSRGRGQSAQDTRQATAIGGGLASVLEVAAPIIGRVLNSIITRVGAVPKDLPLVDGSLNATPELIKVLDDNGLKIEDIHEGVMKEIQGGANPIQAERAARLRTQGIPATRGQITQDDILLGREEMLLQRTDDAGAQIAAPLRARRDGASEAFERNAQEMIDELGLPDSDQVFGDNVKKALTQREKLLIKDKNKLYQLAAEADPELVGVPIVPDNIAAAIPDMATMKRLGRIEGGQIKAFDDLMVEFGLDQTPARVEKFLKDPEAVISPLTFKNFEDFRAGLNQISRADQSGAANVAINPVLDVLDKELDTAFEAISQSPNIAGDTLEIIKQARSKVRELKVEFDPKGTVKKLIDFKKGGNMPTVESSEVYKMITKGSIESVDRIMSSLSKANGGARAIKDLQASVILEALENAMGAASNKGAAGQQLFSPTVFVNALKKLDGKDGKIKSIFRDDPAMYKQLMDLEKSAREFITPSTTKPKGSAPYVDTVIGILGGARALPVIKHVADTVGTGTQVKKSLDTSPQRMKTIEYISREYPSLASVLGVGVITGENDDK